jgi:hypothetical protein
MDELTLRWALLAWPLRCMAIAVLSSTLLAGAAWLFLLPSQQQLDQLRLSQSEQQQQWGQLQSALQRLPHEAELQHSIQRVQRQLEQYASPLPLSALLARRGAHLVQWSPETQPASFKLQLNWLQFQPLFAELAQSTAGLPTRWRIESQPEGLLIEAWLEDEDAH